MLSVRPNCGSARAGVEWLVIPEALTGEQLSKYIAVLTSVDEKQRHDHHDASCLFASWSDKPILSNNYLE